MGLEWASSTGSLYLDRAGLPKYDANEGRLRPMTAQLRSSVRLGLDSSRCVGIRTLTPVMNTNVFLTDRCELSSLGLVVSLTEPAFGWTTPPLPSTALQGSSTASKGRLISPTNNDQSSDCEWLFLLLFCRFQNWKRAYIPSIIKIPTLLNHWTAFSGVISAVFPNNKSR